MDIQEKYERLQEYLQSFGSVAVAFSSGVDSAFLLKVAVDVLGRDQVLAVTASFCSFPEREQNEAREFCEQNGIRQIVYPFMELEIEGFRQNPPNRCYLCKRELLKKIIEIAQENHLNAVVEGSNVEDQADYRPGLAAVKELGIKSPLYYAGLNKAEIRQLSKELGLSTWNKQSAACLASRFAYGEVISKERLYMVDRAEQMLLDRQFHQVRVRVHGQQNGLIARIEILPEELSMLLQEDVREQINQSFRKLGFAYITVDLGGYRTGSMNETLECQEEI